MIWVGELLELAILGSSEKASVQCVHLEDYWVFEPKSRILEHMLLDPLN